MHLGPDTRGLNLDTHARRTAGAPSQYSEHSQALHLGSRFTQFDSEATALGFANDENTHIGSWFTKPTMFGMETRLADLDGTEECIGAASCIAVTADGRSGSPQLIQSKPTPVLPNAQLKSMNLLPFSAWGVRKGVQTAGMPTEIQPPDRAPAPAQWLQMRPSLACVSYPGLKSLPLDQWAKRQQWGMCGAVLPFDVNGRNRVGMLACTLPVIASIQLMSSTTHLGDVESIITHQATALHPCPTEPQCSGTGTPQNLTRAAVEPEHIDELKAGPLSSLDTLR